jgi:uncharacterized protein (TIGR02594 family)
MSLPAAFEWLNAEPGPKMIKEALALLGTEQDLSERDNPVIMAWVTETGADSTNIYKSDEVPWCGLFMAVVAKRAKKQVVKDPLWALNWGTFGKYTATPMLGDVLVFSRTTPDGKKAGHVGLYVGENLNHFFVLGGNQNDCVCIKAIAKDRLYVCRRPNYNQQPPNVRPVYLDINLATAFSED